MASTMHTPASSQEIEQVFRREGPRVLSTLIRLLGDFDLAEDSRSAAFLVALEKWPVEGIPLNPASWLISVGRFKAVDTIRAKTKLYASLREFAIQHPDEYDPFEPFDESRIQDDRLRLIFGCCHPSLSSEAQIALTLREVCGLSTEEIASSFLCSTSTIAQRIVRAKAKIRKERIPFEVPEEPELPERMQNVLSVLYLLFNEGYYTSSGESLTRHIISEEAIRVARLVVDLAPTSEAFGLLSLMLFQESRRKARISEDGDVVLLDDQDPALWDRELLAEGLKLASSFLQDRSLGPYAIQASIASVHMEGGFSGQKDWPRIVSLYDQLLDLGPSPVVELNRAVAVAMLEGTAAGLEIVEKLLLEEDLQNYALAHSTRADFCRRLRRFAEARCSYEHALSLTTQASQQKFLVGRLEEVSRALESP